MTFSKVVIPVAGFGTRLLSATKEQPKEMLPVFNKTDSNVLTIKPIAQMIFEQLFEFGVRNFCFIVGRGKRAIEDHFTPDRNFLDELNSSGKTPYANELKKFYNSLDKSSIIWINQSQPKGFGHAIGLAKNVIGRDEFLVHAGDTVILSKNNNHFNELVTAHTNESADTTILIKNVEDPRQFGVIEGTTINEKILRVTNIEEKPNKPKTNWAVLPLYICKSILFDELEKTRPGVGGEIQLSDAMNNIAKNKKLIALKLNDKDVWVDVGTPATYWDAQLQTHEYFS